MNTPSQVGLAAAIKAIRSELAVKSTWLINYNDQISDQEMLTDMTMVITAYLNAAQPPKGN